MDLGMMFLFVPVQAGKSLLEDDADYFLVSRSFSTFEVIFLFASTPPLNTGSRRTRTMLSTSACSPRS
jgi:hypothetical protein